MNAKRFLLVVTVMLGLTLNWSVVSYAAMLERQESSFWLFVRAMVQSSLDSRREAVIADQSGRFLIRGTQDDFLRIVQRKNRIFVNQMSALTTFCAEGLELTVYCHQHTCYFVVCKKL